MSEYILTILATALTSIISYVAIKIKDAIERKINTRIKQDVVSSCVRYVEQKSSDRTSHDKFCTARQQAKLWLDSKGIEISNVELECLIENEVFNLNKEW